MHASDWATAVLATGTFLLAFAAFLSLNESRKLGSATFEQAQATRVQAETARAGLAATLELAQATREQAELSRRALMLQITPNLLPAGEEQFGFGPRENIASEVQPIRVLPVHVGVFNAGNGVAIIDDIEAAGSLGRAGIIQPPTIGAGETKRIRLSFTFAESVASGDAFSITIRYHGADMSKYRLRFKATYFHPGRWRIEDVRTDID